MYVKLYKIVEDSKHLGTNLNTEAAAIQNNSKTIKHPTLFIGSVEL